MARYRCSLIVSLSFAFLTIPLITSPPVLGGSTEWENTRTGGFGVIAGSSSSPALFYNTPSQIGNELEENVIIGKLAKAALVKSDEFAKIDIAVKDDGANIRGSLESEEQFQHVVDVVRYYIEQRLSGHTKEYLIDSLDAKAAKANSSDPALGFLLGKHPELPPSWLKKSQDWTTTDTARSPVRHVVYTIIDGELAWDYTVIILSDGSQGGVGCENMDAKDRDPKYAKIMKEVNAKVKARMKKEKIEGLGSCYAFWNWKKELLKSKGIEWRSPTARI